MQQWKNSGRRLLSIATAALLLGAFGAGNAMADEPIVFVHGYSGSTGDWNTMVNRFTGDGYASSALYRFGYRSTSDDDKTSAQGMKNFVASVRSQNNNAIISVIAHSNGGLVSRWYRAKLGGSSENRRFITLGAPHKGTQWAYGCASPACFDMRPNSQFLNDLAGKGCDKSLWSATDGIIVPAENAKCGSSTQTANVSHTQLLTDASVYQQVRQALK